jgi:hypothetical protein
MRLMTEFLTKAALFERMADEAEDPALQASLRSQAVAYHRLAVKLAKQLGVAVSNVAGKV